MPGRKNCRLCDKVQPLSEFYPHAGYADGHDNRCRDCMNRLPKTDEAKLEEDQ